MKRPESVAILGGIIFLACIVTTILVGSSIPQPLPPTLSSGTPVAGIPTTETLPGAERARARDVYTLQCAGCHGVQGEGMLLIHPALATARIRQELPVAEIRRIIVEGAGIADIMPPYAGVLAEGDIDLLVRWLRAGMG